MLCVYLSGRSLFLCQFCVDTQRYDFTRDLGPKHYCNCWKNNLGSCSFTNAVIFYSLANASIIKMKEKLYILYTVNQLLF